MWSFFVRIFTALVLGIYSGSHISAGNSLIFIILLFLTVLITGLIFKRFFLSGLLLVFVFSAGMFSYHYQTADSFRPAYQFKDKYVTAIGKICELPEYNENYNTYEAVVQRMYYLGKIHKVNERIRLTSPEKLNFGDSIRAEGFLEGFDEPLNEGDFNAKLHYQSQGIYFKMHSDSVQMCETKLSQNSPAYFFTMIKSRISDIINKNYSGDRAAMLHALLLGYKNYFSEETGEMLNESNAMQVFYPPYLHISLILSFIAFLKFGIGRKKRNYILIALLLFYAAFNFNSLYIVKTALVLAASVYINDRIGFTDYLGVLSIVSSAILLFNPLAAFNSGFILSTSCNIAIFKLYPVLSEKLKFKKYSLRRAASLWLTLLLAILPLQAYFFYKITPFAYLLSLIYIPLLCTLCFAAPLWIFLKIPFAGYIVTALTFIIFRLPERAMKLPFYIISVPKPTITIIIAYYLLLAAFCLRQNKSDRFLSKLAAAVAAGLVFANLLHFSQSINKLKIEFVNVSHGDGAVLSIPFGETIIIDGGGTTAYSDYDYGKEIFVPYLKRNGHTDIDLAVVSHYHEDHCKGVIAAMEKLKVREVLLPDCMAENEYRKEIENIAKDKNIPLSYYEAGTTLNFKSGMVMNILSTGSEQNDFKDENDTSIVLEIEYGNFSALFTGDMTTNIETTLSEHLSEYTLLKVPHHGSLTSSSEAFIDKTSPECAIISTAENSVYSLPNEDIIKRYENRGIDIFRTDKHGNITLNADKSGEYSIMTFKKEN